MRRRLLQIYPDSIQFDRKYSNWITLRPEPCVYSCSISLHSASQWQVLHVCTYMYAHVGTTICTFTPAEIRTVSVLEKVRVFHVVTARYTEWLIPRSADTGKMLSRLAQACADL